MTFTFLGRPLQLTRHGSSDIYRDEYDATHGKYRKRVRIGRTYRATYVLCSPNCFVPGSSVQVTLR